MINARYLTQIAVIAELGSVSRAAEHLNVTQPTLSRTVKIVEDTVGAKIFRRTRHGVTPTEIGQQIVDEGRAILVHEMAAKAAVERWKAGLTGKLRIGIGPMIAETFMDKVLIRAIKDRWPYEISVVVRPAVELLGALAVDELDVVVAPSKLETPSENLRQVPLFADTLVVYGSIDDPLVARGTPVEPSQLLGPWVDFALITGLLNSTDRLLRLMGLGQTSPVVRIAGDVTMGLRIVQQLRGYCFFPLRTAERMRSQWNLGPVPVSIQAPQLEIAVWTQARKHDSPAIRHFHQSIVPFR